MSTTTVDSVPAPRHTPTPPAQPQQSIVLLFCALMLVMLQASLTQTVLAPALPTMVGDLHGVEHMSWVITAFILASTVGMPIYGKLGDLLGRKYLLVLAIVLFTGGSVVGGFAHDMATLITSRVIQGLGGGGLMILSQAIIADVIPARERGKYMGVLGGVFAFSSVAGPLLGGWFTEGPGWRWAFWMNIPLGPLTVVAAIVLVRNRRPAADARPKVDYLGMVLLSLATTAIVLVSTWGGTEYEWDSPVILGLIGIAVVAAVLFCVVESKAAEPVMPLRLFRDRNFNLCTVSALTTGIAMFGAIGYMPTYLQMSAGVNATVAGLLMIPMMGSLLVTSIGVGQIVSRTGRYKIWPIVGSLLMAVGLVLLSTVTHTTPVAVICGYLAVIGLGIGCSMQLITVIVQNSFPLRMVGTATAANNYFRQVGATLGSGVVGSLFISRLVDLITERLPVKGAPSDGANSLTPAMVNQLPDAIRIPIVESYDEALMPLYLYMVPLAVLGAVVMLFIHEKPLATTLEPDTPAQSIAEGQLLANDSAATTDGDAGHGSHKTVDEPGPEAPKRRQAS